jgi:hypothetical protein
MISYFLSATQKVSKKVTTDENLRLFLSHSQPPLGLKKAQVHTIRGKPAHMKILRIDLFYLKNSNTMKSRPH